MRDHQRPSGRRLWQSPWFEHSTVVLYFVVLTVALTWPTVRDFTTKIVSDGTDARHNLWLLWNVQQALSGHAPLFDAPLLYYPAGISLLVHAVGPLEGVLALPFWGWGPSAAYNGATLVGFAVTGYGLYLLARNLGLRRSVALFAGTLLMVSQLHLAALDGHIEKTLLGLLPLVLLAVRNVFNPQRGAKWTFITAGLLLLTLLHSGWQFVLAALTVGVYSLVGLLAATPAGRRFRLRRAIWLGAWAGALLLPLLAAIMQASSAPALAVKVNLQSYEHQPDLIEFFLPSRYSALFGPAIKDWLTAHQLSFSIETAVAFSYVGLILAGVAVIGRWRARWRWLALTLACLVLALGPTLKVLGQSQFTDYQLPLLLPYAAVTSLPGLGFIRTPGQFMLLGLVGFSILAAYGLECLIGRWPKQAYGLIGAAIGLIWIENWPQPWSQETLRPVPAFYQQLAADPEVYGVFDLPLKPAPETIVENYSSYYQLYQMTHHKGIAAGYLSRTYRRHPVFPCFFLERPAPPDVLVDGRPVECHANGQFEVARHNYRYVVFHKPQPEYIDYAPGAWGETAARTFIAQVFGAQPPLIDDALTRVYPVTAAPVSTTLRLMERWYEREDDWRWAVSPATLEIISPVTQTVQLQLTLGLLYDPAAANPLAVDSPDRQGTLTLSASDGASSTRPVTLNMPITWPLTLSPGAQTVTLTLQAGNFKISDYGGDDQRPLSFAIRSIELRTPKPG